jgi:hypothetical protein
LNASVTGKFEDRAAWRTVGLLTLACLLGLSSLFLTLYNLRREVDRARNSGKANEGPINVSTQQAQRMARCRDELVAQIKPQNVDLRFLAGVHGLCYARINEEDTLEEFGIRRGAFLNQQAETGILMWLVVSITISGVLLAGLQLLAGFKLAMRGKAAFEQGGQISLEANKLSLNSSVTGVLVLAISLCFFYIFAREIYLIRVVGEEKGAPPVKSVTSNLDMKAGWDPEPQGLSLPADFGKNLAPINPEKFGQTPSKKVIPIDPAVAREGLRQRSKQAGNSR